MLQNARVAAFTVSELLRKNQQGVKLSPHPDQGQHNNPVNSHNTIFSLYPSN